MCPSFARCLRSRDSVALLRREICATARARLRITTSFFARRWIIVARSFSYRVPIRVPLIATRLSRSCLTFSKRTLRLRPPNTETATARCRISSRSPVLNTELRKAKSSTPRILSATTFLTDMSECILLRRSQSAL